MAERTTSTSASFVTAISAMRSHSPFVACSDVRALDREVGDGPDGRVGALGHPNREAEYDARVGQSVDAAGDRRASDAEIAR